MQTLIQPDAKVVQATLDSQACLKASESMRAIRRPTKGIEQFVKDTLNALFLTVCSKFDEISKSEYTLSMKNMLNIENERGDDTPLSLTHIDAMQNMLK